MKMKKRNTKKAHASFTKRSTHKRKGKERAKEELMRAVRESCVGIDSLHVSISSDNGRRARVSDKKRKDEILARGVFSSSKSGFGFVTLEENEGRDIFIPEDKTAGAIDGDVVEIIYHKYTTRFGEEKTEGRVRKIVEFGRRTIIGTLCYESKRGARGRFSRKAYLLPDDPKISLRPIVSESMGAHEGDKVELLLNRKGSYALEGDVVRNFGRTDTKDANYEAILAECGIDVDFTREELLEAEYFASLPVSYENRVDRTRDVIFTIDGEGAKDLDDAISLRRLKDGWQLGVHIADVSYYIKERGHLDRAVMARGTSVYFTDKVVPMLPKSLSNGACSLNAGEEKYTLSAIINLTANAEIKSVKLESAIIKSRVRGVYSEVNSIFEGRSEKDILKKYAQVIPTLEKMHELYLLLKDKSERRGYVELESDEAEIILSPDGSPIDIVKRERGDAEKMIEQFMLTANEAVATYLYENNIPCVYRIHENPPEDKLETFLNYAHNLGFGADIISKEKAEPSDFQKLLLKAKEKGIGAPVSHVLLRSMSKARYSEEKSRHFGLSIENYCHFTSPIRRLSDLATHRIIRRVLFEEKRPELYTGYARRAAAAATEAELRALSAERRIENLYKTIYMQSRIGEEFDATISSVTSFGFFAELPNTCEGLVPISELDGMYIFDEKNMSLYSRRKTYKLGDSVRVRLEEADIIRGKLRFSVV